MQKAEVVEKVANAGNTDDVIAILTNAPDEVLARQMGAALVNQKLVL